MIKYIIRRLLVMIPTMILISIIAFILLNMAPGDPASAMISPDASPADIAAVRARLGLDAPIHVRYWNWFLRVIRGDLGYSYTSGRPVAQIIRVRLPATIQLVGSALLISTLFGIVLGVISGLKRYTIFDNIFTVLGLVWISIPEFFLGLIGIYFLAVQLNLFPIGGRIVIGEGRFLPTVLPALSLGLPLIAALMRYTRSSVIEVINKAYVDTAFSKGSPPWYVYVVHAFRNAAIPVMIILMFRMILLVSGAVFVEEVFSWPGMGRLMVSAVENRDYPIVLGVLLVISVTVLLVSILIDILTAILDPRVRYD